MGIFGMCRDLGSEYRMILSTVGGFGFDGIWNYDGTRVMRGGDFDELDGEVKSE